MTTQIANPTNLFSSNLRNLTAIVAALGCLFAMPGTSSADEWEDLGSSGMAIQHRIEQTDGGQVEIEVPNLMYGKARRHGITRTETITQVVDLGRVIYAIDPVTNGQIEGEHAGHVRFEVICYSVIDSQHLTHWSFDETKHVEADELVTFDKRWMWSSVPPRSRILVRVTVVSWEGSYNREQTSFATGNMTRSWQTEYLN